MGMKNYPPQFKADAVALYESRPEATINSVAADLGISSETLRNWIRATGAGKPRGRRPAAESAPQTPLEAENAELPPVRIAARPGCRASCQVASRMTTTETGDMPHAIWTGSISFGLVNVPVALFSATENKSVSFHQYHVADGGRVRQKRVCEVDGQEVAMEDIAKGLELPDGDVVVLTDDDFEGLPLPTAKAIEVEAFVPAEQIDPVMYSQSYYLAPEKNGMRAYALLRNAIEKAGKIAVVKVAIRERERLAAVRVRDDVLVLETMYWPDEIRPAIEAPPASADDEELRAARKLIEEMARDFNPEQFTDEYRVALLAAIEAKAEGREVVTPAAPKVETGAKVMDLMAALKASVEAAKKTRPAEKKPAKRAAHPPARKKPAKKAAARRSA